MLRVCQGMVPDKPNDALKLGLTDAVREVVSTCWDRDASKRPVVNALLNCFVQASEAL